MTGQEAMPVCCLDMGILVVDGVGGGVQWKCGTTNKCCMVARCHWICTIHCSPANKNSCCARQPFLLIDQSKCERVDSKYLF